MRLPIHRSCCLGMCSKLFVSFYLLYCTKEVTPRSANKFNYSRMRVVNELKNIIIRGSIFLSVSLFSFNFNEKLSGKKRTKERTDKQTMNCNSLTNSITLIMSKIKKKRTMQRKFIEIMLYHENQNELLVYFFLSKNKHFAHISTLEAVDI